MPPEGDLLEGPALRRFRNVSVEPGWFRDASGDEGPPGAFTALVSDYTVTYDIGWGWQERILAGCFAASIAREPVKPINWEHRWAMGPIGDANFSELEVGLLARGVLYIAEDPLVARIYRSMKAGATDEWSIGFMAAWADIANSDDEPYVDQIQLGDLVEASAVYRGACPTTKTLDLRGQVLPRQPVEIDIREAVAAEILDDRSAEAGEVRTRAVEGEVLRIRSHFGRTAPALPAPEPGAVPPTRTDAPGAAPRTTHAPADTEAARAQLAELEARDAQAVEDARTPLARIRREIAMGGVDKLSMAERKTRSMSFGDQQTLVYAALVSFLGTLADSDDDGDIDIYVWDLAVDWIVWKDYSAERYGLWRMSYTISGDGAVVFAGAPEGVIEVTSYVPDPNRAAPASSADAPDLSDVLGAMGLLGAATDRPWARELVSSTTQAGDADPVV
jgi:HK97 family phage prohead protease